MNGIDEPLRRKAEKLEGMRKHPPAPEFEEMSLDELADILSLTIKHDYENKLVTFLCMLSAFTERSQINVSFNAPSSSGKSYLTTEIAKLFLKEDKIELSGASPTSFFHGEGVYDKVRNAKIVPLSRKILIFYEQPDPTLQAKLRSVLSHDAWETRYQITNKGKKGEHKAELIIMQGFPATIFCSAGLKLDEQEATRAILLSPETTEEKLKEGIRLQAHRSANENEFKKAIESEPSRIALRKRIIAIRDEQVEDVIIPDPEMIVKRFHKSVSGTKSRHMRDMGHLMKLIKAIALLNIMHRRKNSRFEATQSDIDQAFDLWSYFIESQDLNIPPVLMSFYKKYVVPAYLEKREEDSGNGMERGDIGLTKQELAKYYFKKEHSMLNLEHLRKQILPQLESCGLIMQQPPTEGDKRSWHIFPQQLPDENNVGQAGGTPEEDEDPIDLSDIPF